MKIKYYTTYFSPDPLDGHEGNKAGSFGKGLSLIKKIRDKH